MVEKIAEKVKASNGIVSFSNEPRFQKYGTSQNRTNTPKMIIEGAATVSDFNKLAARGKLVIGRIDSIKYQMMLDKEFKILLPKIPRSLILFRLLCFFKSNPNENDHHPNYCPTKNKTISCKNNWMKWRLASFS